MKPNQNRSTIDKKTHVLIIPSWYLSVYNNLSGIFFKEQAEALAKHGNKVGVISIQVIDIIHHMFKKKIFNLSKEIYTENGVSNYISKHIMIPKLYLVRKWLKKKYFSRVFEIYIKKHGLPDIVHVHSYADGNLAIWIKKKYKIPYVITEHSTGYALNKITGREEALAKTVFENSNYNIAVSNDFKNSLIKKFTLKFHYIPNLINTNKFVPIVKKNNEIFNFINVAALIPRKNHLMLVKSFAKAFENNKNVQLTIVGAGSELEKLEKLITKLKMKNQIFLFGKVNRTKVTDLLQKSDAFVMCSSYETFGVVVIEAMSCGIPVVSTKCGGPESIIINEKLGLLSEIEIDDLSVKMKLLYQKRYSYNEQLIRQHVIDNFSEEAVCRQLNKVYRNILNN